MNFHELKQKEPRVPVRPEGKLGQVVAADGKAVEALGKLFGQCDVGGDFGHDVDLQAVFPPDQAVFGHGL